MADFPIGMDSCNWHWNKLLFLFGIYVYSAIPLCFIIAGILSIKRQRKMGFVSPVAKRIGTTWTTIMFGVGMICLFFAKTGTNVGFIISLFCRNRLCGYQGSGQQVKFLWSDCASFLLHLLVILGSEDISILLNLF